MVTDCVTVVLTAKTDSVKYVLCHCGATVSQASHVNCCNKLNILGIFCQYFPGCSEAKALFPSNQISSMSE